MRIGKKSSKREKKGNVCFAVCELDVCRSGACNGDSDRFTGCFCWMVYMTESNSLCFFRLSFLIPLLYKPSNEKYPFGHMQMETVFIVVKGITMITVTVGLITNSINILFRRRADS